MDKRFDGDALNLILNLDNKMERATSRLAPHLWCWDVSSPHQISSKLALQGPVIDTMANWMHADYLNGRG